MSFKNVPILEQNENFGGQFTFFTLSSSFILTINGSAKPRFGAVQRSGTLVHKN